MKKTILMLMMSLLTFGGITADAKEKNMTDKKILVAYFSATGTTAGVAEKLATAVDADLFAITPVQPYSDADLDWRDKQSRSSIEMQDLNSRPEIAAKVENMQQYSVVFVGFPIWWYREPSIIDTFMESYDFTGKTIVPFATSGSSSIGDCGKNIQKLAPQATVYSGRRFFADVEGEELHKWAEQWL